MTHSKTNIKNGNLALFSERELQDAITSEKANGMPDEYIGRKYGVSFKEIEKAVTRVKGINISTIKPEKRIRTFAPKDFKEEQTTVWSFRRRGEWSTHSGEYRGNWSPYIPRNLILRYSKPGDTILDYFCGAGTTAVEAKLLGRKCIALDINDKAIELARRNVNLGIESCQPTLSGVEDTLKTYEPELSVGDARELSQISDNSIDLICSHPPYANIIHYTNHDASDLSFLPREAFITEMRRVAAESFRVLKFGRQCAILIGDMRQAKHVIPLGFQIVQTYLDAGFKLKELVIKRQHNCRTTGFWYNSSIRHNFLLLAHEYLPVFEKPGTNQEAIIREETTTYGDFTTFLIHPKTRRKLDVMETTTVWILPNGKFESQLDRNVIDRYSNGRDFEIVRLDSMTEDKDYQTIRRKDSVGLLFLKSPKSATLKSKAMVVNYLNKLERLIACNAVSKGGFVVIQTCDVRIGNYIEPLAMRIQQMVSQKSLWLKEIITLTENDVGPIETVSNLLQISHQYLLVYEVTA